ncbi:MAG TPA: winged helix-turn-helix domain-containing protein, partial [Nannocystaceae bacterium]|nr:winged helix-turn-helix domain-containing protein [Nannocystaceae bacterium]
MASTSPDPPYARIVAEIRAQIDGGRLQPGDRLPSVREITRRWGVAIATATKVVDALRNLGVAIVRPGVGTLVATTASHPIAVARPPTRSRESEL